MPKTLNKRLEVDGPRIIIGIGIYFAALASISEEPNLIFG
jgi:hypothetical protein